MKLLITDFWLVAAISIYLLLEEKVMVHSALTCNQLSDGE